MIFILFFIIIFAEKSQIMKKIVFLFLICMPICQVVSAQTFKEAEPNAERFHRYYAQSNR